ncbi:MAG: alpha/beta fold hydrolase [Deltaproteobacteria bacterium]|nr:alpha/beta fold hydrolase [Deltaproteobacteria bacterium]
MKKASFNLPDGRQLTWYETGQGHPLVLLHGWSMSAAVFSEVAALLSSDFRLLIPDLPADLSCWIAAMEKAPVTLVGWSLGGMLSLEIARQNKLPVERLVLVSTTPRFTLSDDWQFGLPLSQVRTLARDLEQRFEATLGGFFSLAFVGENITRERLRMIRTFAVRQSSLPDRDAALSLLNMLVVQDQRKSLSEIHQPALVLHGELDQIAPVAAGHYLAEMLPQGSFTEFSGVGHCPFFSQPQVVAARIREFC